MGVITIPYYPRPLQQKFHNERKRFTVMVCHRRFGKTVAAINDILRQAMTTKRKDWRAGYFAPYFTQAKSIAWDYLKEFAGVIPNTKFNESELRCDLPNGARIRLYGTENSKALRGAYFDDIVLDEPADMDTDVWTKILRPTLADRKGRALFIGTPNGMENELYRLWEYAVSDENDESKDWCRFMFRASETGYIDASELKAAKMEMSPEEYEQEFECSFAAAIKGAYYAHLIDEAEAGGRICGVPYDPAAPVFSAWDLGMDDSTAIWVAQIVGKEVHIIDYYENNGEPLSHYADWFRTRPYGYGITHHLPHDAKARELGTGKSREEVLLSLGIGNVEVVPMQRVEDGINAVRTVLPQCWFDKDKTAQGLKALRNYKREWISNRNVFSSHPMHDWSSHGSDAFRYLALSVNEHKYQSQGSFVPRRRRW